MNHATEYRRGPRARRGLAILEIIVAMTIISVGLLALANGTSLVTRQMAGGAVRLQAAVAAHRRLEQLRSQSCASVANGQDTVRGVVSTWTASPVTLASVRRGETIRLTIAYATPAGSRTQTYDTVLPC